MWRKIQSPHEIQVGIVIVILSCSIMTDTLYLLDEHFVGLDGVHFTFRFQSFIVLITLQSSVFFRLLYKLDLFFIWQIFVRFALFFPDCLYVLPNAEECIFVDDFPWTEIMVSLEIFTAY